MTDQSLLAKYIHTKDQEAFNVLVLRYQGLVYAACKRHLRNRCDVEDVSQQVFIALMENAHTVNTNLGGWLHRCTTNKALSMIRSEVSRKRRELSRAVEDCHDDQSIAWKEIRGIIDDCLNHLSPSDKELIIQSIFLKKSQASIAQSIGISQQAIAKRASKAITKLRSKLRNKGIAVTAVTLAATLEEHAVAATVPAELTSLIMHTTTKWAATSTVLTATTAGGGLCVAAKFKAAAVIAATTLLVLAPHDSFSPVSHADHSNGTTVVETMPAARVRYDSVSTGPSVVSSLRNDWIAHLATAQSSLPEHRLNTVGQVNAPSSMRLLSRRVSKTSTVRPKTIGTPPVTQVRTVAQSSAVQTNLNYRRHVSFSSVDRSNKSKEITTATVSDPAINGLDDQSESDSVVVKLEGPSELESVVKDGVSRNNHGLPMTTDSFAAVVAGKFQDIHANASQVARLGVSEPNQGAAYRADIIQSKRDRLVHAIFLAVPDQSPGVALLIGGDSAGAGSGQNMILPTSAIGLSFGGVMSVPDWNLASGVHSGHQGTSAKLRQNSKPPPQSVDRFGEKAILHMANNGNGGGGGAKIHGVLGFVLPELLPVPDSVDPDGSNFQEMYPDGMVPSQLLVAVTADTSFPTTLPKHPKFKDKDKPGKPVKDPKRDGPSHKHAGSKPAIALLHLKMDQTNEVELNDPDLGMHPDGSISSLQEVVTIDDMDMERDFAGMYLLNSNGNTMYRDTRFLSSSRIAAVPEPGTLGLFMIGAVAMLTRRK